MKGILVAILAVFAGASAIAAEKPAGDGRDAAPLQATRASPGTAVGRDPVDYEEAAQYVGRMRRVQLDPQLEPVESPLAAATATPPVSSWRHLGPGNAGGPTWALAIRPENGGVLYAGTTAGAVFKTTDAGVNWVYRANLPAPHAIIGLEPSAAQPNTLFAVTGEVGAGFLNTRSHGIYKSIDDGLHWQLLPSTDPDFGSALGNRVYALRTVATQPETLWAASARGILRSTDGGQTWPSVRPNSDQMDLGCPQLELTPSLDRAIFVCFEGLGWKVYKSKLDGTGVTEILDEVGFGTGEVRLSISKSHPNTIYLAVALTSGLDVGALLAIVKSTDGGDSWTTTYDYETASAANPFNAALLGDFEHACSGQGLAYGGGQPGLNFAFAVDPSNPAVLWVGGQDVYRSNDSGASFGRASQWRNEGQDASGVGRHQHSFVFSPGFNGATNQVMYVAGEGGVHRTSGARGGVQTYPSSNCSGTLAPGMIWVARNTGYSAAQFLRGSALDGSAFLASGPGAGTMYGDDGGTDHWSKLAFGHGSTAIDPVEGFNRFYTADRGGKFTRWVWNAGANDWFLLDGSIGFDTAWRQEDMQFAADPKNRLRFYAGFSAVYRSVDGMGSWQRISPEWQDGVSNAGLRAYGASPHTNLILASDCMYLYRNGNYDAGGAWQTLDMTGKVLTQADPVGVLPACIEEFSFSSNPADAAVYAVANEPAMPKVYIHDSQASPGIPWIIADTIISGGAFGDYLPQVPAHTIAVHPQNRNHLFVGTELGLFASVDRGQHWAVVDTPFPNTPISKLLIQEIAPGARRLIAFTRGRGAWTTAVGSPFADLAVDSWAYSSIERLYRDGITGGCATDPLRFCPTDAVLRDQMAVFLLRAKHGGGYQPPAASGVFSDVPAGYWAAAWIERLHAEGITGGCASDPLKYCPTNAVPRDQMAVFLLKAKHGADYQPPAATGMYSDVPTNYWAAAWIEQLSREGISGGCSTAPKKYCPGSPVTRDQMAVFLVRAFGF